MFDNDDDDLHDEDLEGEEEGDEGEEADDTDDAGEEGEDGSDEGEEEGEEAEDDGSEFDPEAEEGEETEEGEEGEDEGEEELDPETLADLANQDDDGNPTVPKARLDEVLERARLLEEENARLKGGKPGGEDAEPEFDLEAKVKEQIEKQLEGDVDGAAAIALEIEKYRMKVATASAMTVLQQDRQQRSIQKAVDQVLKDYPALDSTKKAKYDHEAFEQVMALRNFYITEKKMPIQSALRKAADIVMKRGATGPKAGKDGGKEGGKTEDEKRIERLKGRAKKAGQQPPDTGKMGEGNRASSRINVDDIDPDDMSDEELDALEKNDPRAFAKLVGNA
ncbi:MAG: hypothetical protein AB7V08_13870 [Elusimicrobiales bacterium]